MALAGSMDNVLRNKCATDLNPVTSRNNLTSANAGDVLAEGIANSTESGLSEQNPLDLNPSVLQDISFNSSDVSVTSEQISSGEITSDSSISTFFNSSDESDCDNKTTDYSSEDDACDMDENSSLNSCFRSTCILSYILRHNLTRAAGDDILELLKTLHPDCKDYGNLNMKELLNGMSNNTFKCFHYCFKCSNLFPDDENILHCQTESCDGTRYKVLSSKQPKSFFIICDIGQQIKELLLRTEIQTDIDKSKDYIERTMEKYNDNPDTFEIRDIVDGKAYRHHCQSGGFLNCKNNISCIFNTDGIPLYKSSKENLWPIFLAINELSPALRFRRENILLAGIWQGKQKPPFRIYMSKFGESMRNLYEMGIPVNDKIVKVGCFLGTLDLQAKAYALNMTMHNGAHGCISCYEEGKTVHQGAGYARSYPYRDLEFRPALRTSSEVTNDANSAVNVSKNGIKGPSGLQSMVWFDHVEGIVPDYMHGLLMGCAKMLLQKFVSPRYAREPFFVGDKIKEISKYLKEIKPPDFVERLPRDLEKHYQHLKASELQMWLLHYSLPCLRDFLPEPYLEHLALLSEASHILLRDSILHTDLSRARDLLDKFYKDFASLYGEGSMGLNVHNAGVHLVHYVSLWGPLFGWSCFGFEDANAHLLARIHGTGDATKQTIDMKVAQSRINLQSQVNSNPVAVQTFLKKMNSRFSKKWKCTLTTKDCEIAGALKDCCKASLSDQILQSCAAKDINHIKEVQRIKIHEEKFYCKKYSRQRNRISYIVICRNGLIVAIEYFLLNTVSCEVFLFGQELKLAQNHYMFDDAGHHILQVIPGDERCILPVTQILEKVIHMKLGENKQYISRSPNKYGHGVLK